MSRIRSRSSAAYEEYLAELNEYMRDHDLTDEDVERQTKQAEEDFADIYGRE